jgi:large subunit ribosomal protein LP2
LLHNLNYSKISLAEINAVLAAAGIKADDAKVQALLKELAGKDVNTLMTEGKAQLAKFGGGGGGGGGAAPAAAAATKEAPKAAEVAKVVEKEESGEGEMELDLFG